MRSDERTGAQILCEALIREGVRIMFGIPGGAIMPFYHAMPQYRDRLHHVLCRHEQGAGHAAEGYARATGHVGVCIGTSGPGATNLVTPIADAYMDSTPLLAITGQVHSALIGTDAFQETDITGITLPITKYSYFVDNVRDIPHVIHEAMYLARSGRPGPVLVDVTKDAQQARCIPDWNVQISSAALTPNPSAPNPDITAAIEVMRHAHRPLVMAGNGVIQSGATAELLAFAERSGIPVITTLHGLGAFPATHPLALGMPGMHGASHVNRAIQQCDAILAIGMRFDDRVTGKVASFAPHARVVHVDVDRAELGKLVRADVKVHGDAREVLAALFESWPGSAIPGEWMDYITSMRRERNHKTGTLSATDEALAPADVYFALDRAMRARGPYRVVTDVGQHQMWAAQQLTWDKPRTHITSGGAGTMGFAVPAALGVALAYPDETVWVICGDGGFQMTNQELATMCQERVRNVKIAIVNNGCLGMVRQWQQLFEQRVYSNTLLSGPDFARLAEAYGVRGETVTHRDSVQSAIDAAYAYDGPVVIDFQVAREMNVFPIVPQGSGLGEMLLSEPNAAASVNHSQLQGSSSCDIPLLH